MIQACQQAAETFCKSFIQFFALQAIFYPHLLPYLSKEGVFINGVRILSVDAKDLFLANHYLKDDPTGYRIRLPDGEINTRRFTSVLDYSLDLIKLRAVYEKVYRNRRFSFWKNGYEYSTRIINVTFTYSNKTYNKYCRFRNGKPCAIYVKFGYNIDELEFQDHICVVNGELAGIETEVPVLQRADNQVLGDFFFFQDGVYKAKSAIPTLDTVADLRNNLYENGFYMDGVKYVRYKRSSGSSRLGKCLFIDARLYPQMHKWEMCGIKVRPQEAMDLAALEAYISLTLSSIIGTVNIGADNILLIQDYESIFQDEVMETTLENGRLLSRKNRALIKNSIWDGQSLADESLFQDYPTKSMLLLRARFFKSAAFKCNIQKWFQDNNITEVSQLKGYTRATDIRDIKLITTPSSIKYLKFGAIDQWLDMLEPQFGVVKCEKSTCHFDGRMVQSHYQLINTLQLSRQEVERLVQPALSYVTLLKTDPAALRYQVNCQDEEEFSPKSLTGGKITYSLLGINEKFSQTKYYDDFRKDLTKAYIRNLRCGHVLIHGNYSTLLGNPMEMLQASIGIFTGESQIGAGNIHSKAFRYNQTLLGSRSPHVTIGNIWLPINKENEAIDRYFDLSKEVVCINSIGEATLDRLSGADYDSDMVLLTDNPVMIAAAKRNYSSFPVPVNHVASTKTRRCYTATQKAQLDIRTSVNKIGEIINLSQELNCLLWDRLNNGEKLADVMELYRDICQLDVMSGIEIDKAKKEFDFDNAREMKLIRDKYSRLDDSGRAIKPDFFGHIARRKGYYDSGKKNYLRHDTSMDYLEHYINRYQRARTRAPVPKSFLKLSDILNTEAYTSRQVYYDQIERVIRLLTDTNRELKSIYSSSILSNEEKFQAASEVRKLCMDYLGNLHFNNSTMICLLRRLETKTYKPLYRLAISILFGYPNSSFFAIIASSKTPLPKLTEAEGGEIRIYDFHFTKQAVS